MTTNALIFNKSEPETKLTTDWQECIDDFDEDEHEVNLNTWIFQFKSHEIDNSSDDVVGLPSPGYDAFCASSSNLVQTLQDVKQINFDCTKEVNIDVNSVLVPHNDRDADYSCLPQSPCCSVQDNKLKRFEILVNNRCNACIEEVDNGVHDIENDSSSRDNIVCFDTSLFRERVDDVTPPEHSIDLDICNCLGDDEDASILVHYSSSEKEDLPYFDERKNRRRQSQLSRRKAAFEEKHKWKLYLRAITRIQSQFRKINARKQMQERFISAMNDTLKQKICKSTFFTWLVFMDTDIKQRVVRRLGLLFRRAATIDVRRHWYKWTRVIQLLKAFEVIELLSRTLIAATIRCTCIQWKRFVVFEQKVDSVNHLSRHVKRIICTNYLKFWQHKYIRARHEHALILLNEVANRIMLFQYLAKWKVYLQYHHEAKAAQIIQKFLRGYNVRVSFRKMVSLNFTYLDVELDGIFCEVEDDLSFLSKVDEISHGDSISAGVWQPKHPFHDSERIGISSEECAPHTILLGEDSCDVASLGGAIKENSYSPNSINTMTNEKEVDLNDWSKGVTKVSNRRFLD